MTVWIKSDYMGSKMSRSK